MPNKTISSIRESGTYRCNNQKVSRAMNSSTCFSRRRRPRGQAMSHNSNSNSNSSTNNTSFASMMRMISIVVTLLTLFLLPSASASITSKSASTSSNSSSNSNSNSNSNSSSNSNHNHNQRMLEIGDFYSINQVLKTTKFKLPDRSGTEDSTTLRLSNIVCRNVHVGDVQVEHSTITSSTNALLEVTIQVIDLDLICEANYEYNGWLMNGKGDVQVTSQNNDVTVRGSILRQPQSSTASASAASMLLSPPPSTITMDSCTPAVQISNIEFDNGGFLGWVLNLIEGLARGIMETLVEDMLCQELQQALENAQGVLERMNERLDEYSPTTDDNVDVLLVVDPLQDERDLPNRLDASVQASSLLDLSSPQTKVGQWVQQTLHQGIDYLRATVPDPFPITADSPTDLQANIWMRQFLLNDDRGLAIVGGGAGAGAAGGDGTDNNSNNIPQPTTLFYNHDELLETTIQLQRVQLLGLDTLNVLDPLSIIGQYTIQSQVSWEYLALEVDATLDIRPSSLDNAVVTGQGEGLLLEDLSVVIGLGSVQASMALLAAIHQEVLESLQIGSLLSTANLLPCLVSTVVELALSSFFIEAGDIYTPYLSGLDSVGLDRILDEVLEIVFLLYEDVVLQRSPAFFQQDFRQTLNVQFLQQYLNTASRDCPLPNVAVPSLTNAPAGFVDFRDLLLSPLDASSRGGSGTEPYGDLFSSMITPNLDVQLMGSIDQFNERFVRPATKAQSGVEGALMWPDWVGLDYTADSTSLFDAALFHVSNLRIHNLDTVAEPLNLLDAQDWNSLFQTLTFQSNNNEEDKAFNVSASFLFAVGGEDSPLAMTNQVDLTLTIPSITLSAGILAHMKEEDLLQFPLVDATNPYCWLTTLASYDDGVLLAPLVLDTLALSLDTFSLESECISCTSPGAYVLSELLRDDLPRFGFQAAFASRIMDLAQDIAWHVVEEFDLESLMAEAIVQCPHQSSGNGATGSTVGLSRQQESQQSNNGNQFSSGEGVQAMIAMDALSENSVETVLGLGMVAMQAAIAMVARNHALLVKEGALEAPSMSSNRTQESYYQQESTSNVLDWTNLSSGNGGGWADFAFEEIRKYILAPVKSGRILQPNETVSNSPQGESKTSIPRLLSMLQDHVLDENGVYVFDVEQNANIMAEAMGVQIAASQVRVSGLDTLSGIDLMVPIQPQVLRNRFHLDDLTVVIDASLNIGDTRKEAIQFTYSAKNISAQLDLLIALDLDAVQAIRIGSLFNTSDILSCMTWGLQDVQIHQLSTSIAEIEGPQLSGFLSSSFQSSVDSILTAMSGSYHADVLSAMPVFLDSTFRDLVNAMVPDLIDSIQSNCPAPPAYPELGLVDFRELLLPANASRALGANGDSSYGNLFQMLYGLLEENILRTGATNRPVVNDIFRHVTNEQSNVNGSFIVEENAFDSQTKFKIAGLEAIFGFQISNVTLENIDSVGDPLDILRPMMNEAHVLKNALSFGVDSRPVRLAATFVLALSDGVEMNIRNAMRVALTLEDVAIMAEILLKISERSFAGFPIGDLNNINCWLATILSHPSEEDPALRGIGLEEHSFSIGNFSFGISCEDCTSPDFDRLLMSLYDFENSTVLESTIRHQTDGLFDADFVPVVLDQVVEGASKRCPHHPNYDPNATPVAFLSSPADSFDFFEITSNNEKSVSFNIVNTIIAMLLCLVGFLAALVVRRRNRKWVESLSREGSLLLQRQQEKDRQMQEMLNASTQSLFTSPSIPRRIRYGVPLAILVNIVLYMGGHLFGTLSVVNVDVALAGEEFTIYEFLEFKFIESTRNTYNNGGAEMAVLLWMFTGVWPYIKLVLSLVLWIVPPTRLSVYRRGQALLWIDALAKLSVIDIFTLLLGFAILLVFIGGPDESLSSSAATLYAFKAIIVPRAGFYCLIIGQRMSRVSSKFLLECHDRAIDAATKQGGDTKSLASTAEVAPGSALSSDGDGSSSSAGSMLQRIDEVAARVAEDEDGKSTASFDDRFDDVLEEPDHDEERTHGDEDEPSTGSANEYRWGTMGVIFGAITIFIIFVIGCIFAPAISLDTSSIAGLAVESGKTYEDVVNEYGVFLVISSVLLKASFVLDSKADYVGLGFLLVGALVSAACVFFFQAYQFIKRKMKERRIGPVLPSYGHRGCGLPLYLRLHKWKHMEIYLISVTIGVWQLGSACSYAIYQYCDILHQAYSLMAFIGLTEESTAQCSRIQATDPGNLIIIGLSFLMLLLAFFFQAAAQYKKNIAESLRFVDDDDVPRLSLAWSRDKSKNSRYSHLTASLSMDQLSSEFHDPPIPSTPCTSASTTPPSTPRAESIDMDSNSNSSPAPATPGSPVYSTPPRSSSFPSQRTRSNVRFHSEDDDQECLPPSPPRVHSREIMSSSVAVNEQAVRLGYRPSHEYHHEILY